MKKLILILGFLTLISSCSKKSLDLSARYYNVDEIFNSSNCQANCHETAACEGRNIKVSGYMPSDHVDQDHHQFYVTGSKYRLQVYVNDSIADKIFAKIQQFPNKNVEIEGKIKGNNAHTNITCRRIFALYLDYTDKLKFVN